MENKQTPELRLENVVWVNNDVMSGAPCFIDTRVPLSALLDALSEGEPLELFLRGYPCVSMDQAMKVLKLIDEDGVLYNKDKTVLICFPNHWQGDYVIPDGVKIIVNYAFRDCIELTSIAIPKSVVEIGKWVFTFWNSGEEVTGEDGKTSSWAGYCDLPAQIIVHPENPVYASENGKLIEK